VTAALTVAGRRFRASSVSYIYVSRTFKISLKSSSEFIFLIMVVTLVGEPVAGTLETPRTAKTRRMTTGVFVAPSTVVGAARNLDSGAAPF
jgi:hypothetical protein